MCSVLPEDKQGPVLDDIRKISKERRRLQWPGGGARVTEAAASSPSNAWRSDASPTAGGLIGVYRSTSELRSEPPWTADDRDVVGGCVPLRTASGGGLMATVRAARRKQSMSSAVVYNPAFYDAPVTAASGPASAAAARNPAGQPYLCMTPDNGFSLRHQPPHAHRHDDHRHREHDSADPTTQL